MHMNVVTWETSTFSMSSSVPAQYISQGKAECTSKAESALSSAKIMASQISLRSTVRLRRRSSNLQKQVMLLVTA